MNKDPKLLTERGQPPIHLRYPDLMQEDEISLIDLWLMLLRHKRLIAGVFAAVLALGVLAALAKPTVYAFTTTIQIARSSDGPIEQPETLLAKLNESYIPFVIQENLGAQPGANAPRISAKIPKGSDIIVMESAGREDEQEQRFEIHDQVLDRLAQDHDPEVAVIKLAMGNELSRIRNQLDKLKDEAQFLLARGKRLDEQEALFREQLKSTQKLIENSEANRSKAVKEVEGEAKAMTLMLIDNETKKYQDREGEIKKTLLVGLPADRDQLKNDLADNLRRQSELQEKQQEVQAKLANIRYTRPITPTLRSLEPKGTGKPVIIALAGILGLMLGVFCAFLAEFHAKTKARLNEREFSGESNKAAR